jgi:hypothetical protein
VGNGNRHGLRTWRVSGDFSNWFDLEQKVILPVDNIRGSVDFRNLLLAEGNP